jgi:hypothetical protein
VKTWSNKEHEEVLDKKREKRRQRELSALLSLDRAGIPRTIILGKDNMKTKLRPADSRYTLEEIVDPVYMSIEQYRDACYIPDNIRHRIVIIEFLEDDNGTSN